MVSPVLTLFRQIPTSRRRTRRLAVIAAFSGLPLQFLGYQTLVVPGRLSLSIWGPITIVLFAATLIGAIATYGFGQGRLGDRSRLDERQRAMNDRALVISYGVVTTVVTLVLGAVYLVASSSDRSPSRWMPRPCRSRSPSACTCRCCRSPRSPGSSRTPRPTTTA